MGTKRISKQWWDCDISFSGVKDTYVINFTLRLCNRNVRWHLEKKCSSGARRGKGLNVVGTLKTLL